MVAEQELLTIQEAADYLRVCEKTLYRWLRAGKIRGYRAGRQWRLRRSDLDAWLLAQQNHRPTREGPGAILARLRELRRRNRELLGREVSAEELRQWIDEGRRELVGPPSEGSGV